MGIPKQVIEAEKEADEEIAAEAVAEQPRTEETVVEPQKEEVAEVPQTEPEPAKPEHKEGKSLLSRIGADVSVEKLAEEADVRYRSLNGKFVKSERENAELRRKLESYESEIENLRREIEEQRNAPRSSKDEIDDIRKELGEGYSDEDVEHFTKAVDARVERATRALKDRLDANDAEKLDAAKRAAKSKADKFVSDLEKDFPGFREIDSSNDPRWIEFLGSSLGGVMEGTTYGDIAKSALEALDYRKFSSVVREFAKNAGIVFSPNGKPSDAEVKAGIRPASVNGDARHQQNQPRVFPRSEIEHFRKIAFANKATSYFGLKPEQVRDILRQYEEAEADGRVAENR